MYAPQKPRMKHHSVPLAVLCLFFLMPGSRSSATPPSPLDPRLLDAFVARSIGPACTGGRITALAVAEAKPKCMYVGAANGGAWKTTNNGTTWTPVFDGQSHLAIGDVAVAPSNADIVWVGTGEANARNSVSWGNGVYKSLDGAKTWQHVGLEATAHIGRIVIHPQNPDVVYVAALGRMWAANRERGIYKTMDGGKSWRQVAFVDEDTGFIDLAMDAGDPSTLYAAAFACRRDAFAGGNPKVQFGAGAGIYKSIDAGESWVKLRLGLPDRAIGRCGLAISRKNPRLLYVVVATDKTDIRGVPGQPPRASTDKQTGGIFRSQDRGETWTKVNDLCPRPFYFGQIRIDPSDDQRVYVLGVPLFVSKDAGKTFTAVSASHLHGDQHALWIDPRDPEHLVLGSDGGLSVSYDRGTTWEHFSNLPISQFYAVAVDLRKPYRTYGGLQDNGTWSGPSATHNPEGITAADWFRVLGMDGYYCQVDPTDPDTVYAEGQYGLLHRVNVRTGASKVIRPRPGRHGSPYRFNWSSPLLISPHSPRTLYFGGNYLFRSADRGERWQTISPDLTLGNPGPSADAGHTLTTIAESPLRAGVLYTGSDDGRVCVSRDGGARWTDVSANLPGVPAARWISRIECSHFAEGTAYLTLDRHRLDDNQPYVFKTTDCGATWTPLRQGLPQEGHVHVIREDARNRDLLFLGTEFGLYVSVNGGAMWQRLRAGLPAVPIHDLVIHPREHELVIATHGRGAYVLDIAPLQEFSPTLLALPAHLFDIKPVTLFRYHGAHGQLGNKSFNGANPPAGAVIHYYLREPQPEPVRVTITNTLGESITELTATREAGIHSLVWDLRERRRGPVTDEMGMVPPGEYTATLWRGQRALAKKFRVDSDAREDAAGE
jgi:photosystem II stability/assembly factor-like uncharacterized protein